MGKSRLTEAEIAEMASRYLAGETSTVLGAYYGVHAATVYDLLRTRGVAMRSRSTAKRRYAIREDAFRSIGDEPTAYWLGFSCADGCVVRRRGSGEAHLVLQERDIPHLENYRAFLGTDAPIRKETHHATFRVSAYSKVLADDLITLGCSPNKSLDLAFPTVPPGLVSHFVRGYFDGDGSAMVLGKYQDPTLQFVGSTSFIPVLRETIFRCTQAPGALSEHARSPVLYLTYRGAFQAAAITAWLYANATIWLRRKREVVATFRHGKRSGYPSANAYVGTTGAVSSETVRKYIEAQKGM